MKFANIGAVILTVSLAAACAKNPSTSTDSGGEEIVNGKKTEGKSALAQSVVALSIDRNNGQALCSGSIIAEDIVLTAAHCVDDNPSKILIVFSTRANGTAADHIRTADGYTQNSHWKKRTSRP